MTVTLDTRRPACCKFTYDEHDDLVRDVRDYTSRLDLSTPPVDNTTADAPTLDLVVQIRETTARDIHGAPASPIGSGTAPTQAAAGSSGGAPSATGSGTAPSQSAAGSSAAGSSTGTPSARTLRELRRLALFTQGEFPDVAHRDGYHNVVEYAYAVTNTQHQSRSEGKNIKIIPISFKEAMLPEAQQWKDASEKEMSLQDLNVYTLVPRSGVRPGKKVTGAKWVYKVKPDNTFKARLGSPGLKSSTRKGLRQHLLPCLQASEDSDGARHRCGTGR